MRIRFVRPVDDRATDQGMPARQWPMKQKRDGPQTLVLQTRRICPGEHFPCAAVMIAARGTDGLQTRRWRERDSNLYGAFPVKWCFWFVVGSLFGAGKPFFIPSPAIGSRSARKGARDRNGSKALAACRLAALVFRSALTPEHAERR